jgi:signal peptidase I
MINHRSKRMEHKMKPLGKYIRMKPNKTVPFLIVHGGSMSPSYQDGDLIIARRCRGIFQGDVVIFREPVNHFLIVHRVIRSDTNLLITKGDANGGPDPNLLNSKEIVGKVWFRIPKIGLIIRHIQRRRKESCQIL